MHALWITHILDNPLKHGYSLLIQSEKSTTVYRLATTDVLSQRCASIFKVHPGSARSQRSSQLVPHNPLFKTKDFFFTHFHFCMDWLRYTAKRVA